jgi:hypothetical protein
MKICDVIDMEYFLESEILRLPHVYPVCPYCRKSRPFGERQYIDVVGKCPDCVSRTEAIKNERA